MGWAARVKEHRPNPQTPKHVASHLTFMHTQKHADAFEGKVDPPLAVRYRVGDTVYLVDKHGTMRRIPWQEGDLRA